MNWNELNTYGDWAGVLDRLLTDAHDAVAADDRDQKRDAQRALKEFIDNCASPVKASELDEIATQAINNIFEATLDKAMAEIGSRTAELANLTKEIKVVTDTANKDAASIRLEKARQVVSSTVQAIEALKDLRQSLKSNQPDEKKLSDGIIVLIGSIQTIRNQVETLNH